MFPILQLSLSGETFPKDDCTRMCYCNARGDEMCPTVMPTSCKANRESCDNVSIRLDLYTKTFNDTFMQFNCRELDE